MLKLYTIHVKVVRSYGGGDRIEFGVTGEVEARSINDLGPAYQAAVERINDYMDQYETENQNRAMQKPAEAQQMNGNGQTYERVEFDRVLVVHNERGRIVKLAGGKYSQFGVPLYAEKYNLLPGADTLPIGTHEKRGVMRVECEGGKPRRVVGVDIHE